MKTDLIKITSVQPNLLIDTDQLRDKLLKYGNVELLVDKDRILTLYMTNFLIADNVFEILNEVMNTSDKKTIHHLFNGLHYLLLIMK